MPNEFIGIFGQAEDAIQRCGSNECSELREYEHENERNWENRGKTVLELGMEPQEGSKIVPHSTLLPERFGGEAARSTATVEGILE